jgi:multiple sugar transport system ATP-binding protein
MAKVTLERVEKIYPGGFKAVHGLDLDVADGEFLVLVGPSGCGKSTTLRMIAGLESITEGTLRIGDLVVNEIAPKDRDIAMVFQSYALYPHMTVRENMAFGLTMRKRPASEIKERVQWAADALGLMDLLERRPKALSGGQRQRVALGRAIVRDPQVFLLDEPLSNLDARLRLETRAELKRLHRKLGTTTVYVTHDQEEAMTLGDRVAVMNDGVLHQCASPLEVYQQPVDRFVAGFLGTPPMNFLDVDVGVAPDADGVNVKGAGFIARLPRELVASSHGSGARPAVLGVRPESLQIHDGHDHPDAVRGTVDLVEPLGGQIDVVITTASGEHLVARVPARELAAGDEVSLTIDPRGAHLFAAEGDAGRNLALG